jgi:hypothetical protein
MCRKQNRGLFVKLRRKGKGQFRTTTDIPLKHAKKLLSDARHSNRTYIIYPFLNTAIACFPYIFNFVGDEWKRISSSEVTFGII